MAPRRKPKPRKPDAGEQINAAMKRLADALFAEPLPAGIAINALAVLIADMIGQAANGDPVQAGGILARASAIITDEVLKSCTRRQIEAARAAAAQSILKDVRIPK